MAEQVFKKDTSWGANANDFKGEDEIMVHITLHEYRELVEIKAKQDYRIEQKNKELFAMEKERDEAKLRVETLLATLNGNTEEESDD